MFLTLPDKERFWNKVNRTESCWLWTASTRNGYGAFKLNGSVYDAHRVAWQIEYGEIPRGMDICHSCDNKVCVNPSHLFVGTRSDNMQDASAKGRLVSSKRILTPEQVKQVRQLHSDGMMRIDIAVKFHVSERVIYDIVVGNSYKEI